MQVLFQIKISSESLMTLGNTDIHHIGAADNLIVHLVFRQFEVISLYLE